MGGRTCFAPHLVAYVQRLVCLLRMCCCSAEELAVQTMQEALELTSREVTAVRQQLQEEELRHAEALHTANAAVGRRA